MGHREALMEGAIRCIHEKGWAQTTARDLVAASGTNLASIGYHYRSKDALLREAMAESFMRWFTPLIEMVSERGIEASLRGLLGGLDEHRPLIASHFEALADSSRNPELRSFIAERYAEFRTALAERLGGAESREAAGLVMCLLDGAMVQWLLGVDWRPDVEGLLRAVEGVTARAA